MRSDNFATTHTNSIGRVSAPPKPRPPLFNDRAILIALAAAPLDISASLTGGQRWNGGILCQRPEFPVLIRAGLLLIRRGLRQIR
jgi:hypothetical protein